MAAWWNPLMTVVLLSAGCSATFKAIDEDGDGYTWEDGDCWDGLAGPEGSGLAGADIHPGADETWYDGTDQDCDGSSDFDADGDGVEASPQGLDCDDADPGAYPGAPEVWYDGTDQDCDGLNDFDADGDGFAANEDDCDDADAAVNPGATEVWYDGTDQDCDGASDFDADGDGYIRSEDCDDSDPDRYPDPDIEEIWYDGVDQDCDGNDGDQDGDGYVPDDYAAAHDWTAHNAHIGVGDCWDDPTALPAAFDPINGFSALSAAQVSPVAEERWYDGVDQDCGADDDFDADGDGYASDAWLDRADELGRDCVDQDDDDPDNPAGLPAVEIFPGAADEWYDGTDQNCDGADDFDQDRDGYQAAGYGEGSNDDCEDTVDDIHPGATERCATAYDDDCDGDDNDEGATGCSTYYADSDGDSYGGAASRCLCEAEASYTATSYTDCNDALAAVNPAATESCATTDDDDCDGDDNDEGATGCSTFYADSDGDGYGDSADACLCEAAGDFDVTNDDDCDDSRSGVYPGATEKCTTAYDDDCDGDDNDEGAKSCTSFYADDDGDGYGAGSATCLCEATAAASSSSDADCDDTDKSSYPGAPEVCGDGLINDCDGSKGEAIGACDGLGGALAASESWATITGNATSMGLGGALGCGDLSGDGTSDLVASAPAYSSSTGRIFVLAGPVTAGTSRASKPIARFDGVDTGDTAGFSLGVGADLDGDRYEDLLIGSPGEDDTSTDNGAVYLLSGPLSGSSLLSDGDWSSRLSGGSKSAFGYALSSGDLDGDGVLDLAAGSPLYDLTATDMGAAWVRYGPISAGDDRITAVYDAVLVGVASKDHAGSTVAAGADVDGDGVHDLLVGAPESDPAATRADAGRVYLILGPVSGSALLSSAYDLVLTGVLTEDAAGTGLANAGDLDGDGYADIAVGAPGEDTVSRGAGAAYVVLGSAGPTGTVKLSSADAILYGDSANTGMGACVAGDLDLDGDGAGDLVVGSGGSSGEHGAAWVYYGPLAGTLTADATLTGGATGDAFGCGLTGSADLSGDGEPDLALGAVGLTDRYTDEGSVSVFLGGTGL